MRKLILSLLFVSLMGIGCMDVAIRQSFSPPAPAYPTPVYKEEESPVVLPLDGNIARYQVSFKGFGEYIQDRFTGYHVGEDIEMTTEDLGLVEAQEVPIRSTADGTVRFVDWVAGYGGLLIVRHTIKGVTIHSLYGHMDLSSISLKVDDAVKRGQFLGNLGEGNTKETDQERKHLHFALYKGDELKKNGYEQKAVDVKNWMNPTDFFRGFDLLELDGLQDVSNKVIPLEAEKAFPINFDIPTEWDAEYIPSLRALNLYTLSGDGTARERSQIFIRYFDADKFLTLPTVTIHSTKEMTVGGYVARQYDIEKKHDVPDFRDQPSWRNTRHLVTDFREKEGKTRYYVIAANPKLDPLVYDQILQSMKILKK